MRRLMALALMVAASLPATVRASSPTAHITDIRGDANGLTFPYAPGGVVGNLQRELLREDPLGNGTSTEPASIPELDVLAVRFETTHVGVPVGDDGIDYRATGLRVHLSTTAMPRSLGPTTSYELNTHLPPGTIGCRLFISATFRGPLSPPSTDPSMFGSASLGGSADGCSVAGGTGVEANREALKLTVSSDPPGLTIEVPQTAFVEDARPYLDEGATLMSPSAWTQVVSLAPRVDATALGTDFPIGADMPADVPCTRGCPPA